MTSKRNSPTLSSFCFLEDICFETSDDLAMVTRTMKRIVILKGLNKEKWADEHDDVIFRYLIDTNLNLLVCFIYSDSLHLQFGIPDQPVSEIFYFIKKASERITTSNFASTVQFGTAKAPYIECLYQIMCKIYGPMFLKESNWSDCVKSQLPPHLSKCLERIFSARNTVLKRKLLYVPKDISKYTVEDVIGNRDLVREVEGVVVTWLQIMRASLVAHGDVENSVDGPVEELELWQKRVVECSEIIEQLRSEEIQSCIVILNASKSSFYHQFNLLYSNIQEGASIADENVKLLMILKKPCEAFENDNLQNTAEHLTKILDLIRIIFRKSSYYNTNTLICGLLRKVSNLLIQMCCKEMNVDEMLENLAFMADSMVLERIACCNTWKEVYAYSEKVHSIHSSMNWKIDSIGVFAPVDALILRCKNLLEVFKYKRRFHVAEASEGEPSNFLRGERGIRVLNLLKSSEETFLLILKEIAMAKEHALNVQATTWNDHFSLFKIKVQNLELFAAKSLSSSFEDLKLVEEGVEMLRVFHKFSEQEVVRRILHGYVTELYDLFLMDINFVKMEVLKRNTIKSSIQPVFAGTAYTASIVIHRLQRAYRALEDADFLPNTDYRKHVMLEYRRVLDALEELSFGLFLQWSKTIPKDPQKNLSSHIFCGNTIKPEGFDLKLSRDVIKLIQELSYWEKKHTEIPQSLIAIRKKCDDYMKLEKKVMFLVREYNKIIIKLSPFELKLFQPILSHLNEKYSHGFKISWLAPRGMLVFMKECRIQCLMIAKTVDLFKDSNLAIANLCEDISYLSLFEKDIRYPLDFSDFINLQHDHREAKQLDLLKLYNKVMEEATNVLHIVGGERVFPLAYNKYLEKINALLKTAIKQAFASSLEDICSVFSSSRVNKVKAVLKIKLTLKDRQMAFNPSATEIICTLQNIMQGMISVLSNVKYLHLRTTKELYADENIYSNAEAFHDAEKYIRIIRKGFTELKTSLDAYLSIWQPYSHLWITSKSSVLQFYQAGQWTAENFEEDIMRFLTSGKNAQNVNRFKMIQFCIMDCEPLKDAAHELAQEWKNLLGSILREISCRSLKNAVTFLYMASEKFSKEPQSLNELKHCIEFLKTSRKISQRILPTIVPMYKNFCVLKKFDLIPDYKTYYQLCHLKEKWDVLEKSFKTEHVKLQKIQAEFQRHFMSFGVELGSRVQAVLDYFMETGPFSNDYLCDKAFKQIRQIEIEFHEMKETEEAMQRDSVFFDIILEPLQTVIDFENVLTAIKTTWFYVKQYLDFLELWEDEQVLRCELPSKMKEVKELHKKCRKLKNKVNDEKWIVITDLIIKIKELEGYFRIMGNLQNKALHPRHWEELAKHLHLEFDPSSEQFTLKYLQTLNIQDILVKTEAISTKATNEYAIEQGIQDIVTNCHTLDLKTDRRIHYYELMETEEFLAIIEDHQMTLGAMKASKYVKYFAEVVDELECSLSLMQEVVDLAQLFQRRYFYLENIFYGKAIRRQLPKETVEFDSVSGKWQELTILMHNVTNAWKVSHEPDIVPTLLRLNQKLETVQFSLDSYLETKRQAFPRFYFISNDDLLSILGQAENPFAIQPHLKKCFDNIVELKFDDAEKAEFPCAVGMHSDDGEYVEFVEPIPMQGFVESWLGDVETAMRDSLRRLLGDSLGEFELIQDVERAVSEWIKALPGQVCWMGIQIAWTADITRSIKTVQQTGVINALKHSKKKWMFVLQKISKETLGKLCHGEHEKFMAIILTLVHARDIVDMLLLYNCNDTEAFEWLRQLRFYYFKEEDGDKCIIKQTTAEFSYAYEYLGNRRRLVITPLTDRCYLTMTTALHLSQGVCLKGPSGCGKTETIKDLGKALGCYVLVVNCSESLDFKSLGKMLSGLAQIGAWCSFDEFNRINVEVLSVIAMRILTIFRALKTKMDRFVFERNEICLRHSCGIFITLNPATYAGRSELPYNLVYMFRPLSMMAPDVPVVSEIILYGNNFEDSGLLSDKIQAVFSIASMQLSKQFHYDFGLRSIIQVLRCAIHAKQEDEDITAEEVIFASILQVTIPKLHSTDLPIFKGIMTDVFGDLRLTVKYPDMLKKAVVETLRTSLLQTSPTTLNKVLEFYETKCFHHAVILIGETGSGKSTTWKTLKGASCLLANWHEEGYLPIQVHAFNPKAVTFPEVFGELDMQTGDWNDGILSSLVRTTCSDEKLIDKWLLFDGPADTQWVESMNSLMDDNKILTLINGERIVLSPRVSLIFEVTNLRNCSPATVSRCGVVYHDYDSLGWEPYFESWLEKNPQNEVKQDIKALCDKYLKPVLAFKRRHSYEFLTVTELNAVMSFCRFFETFLPRVIIPPPESDEPPPHLMLSEWFIFSLIWTVCGCASDVGRMEIDTFFRELYTLLPIYGTVYDYCIHPEKGWIPWTDLLSETWNYNHLSRNVLVPTKDTLSYEFVTSALLRNGHPVLFVGDVGAGKTLVGNHVLQNLDDTVFDTLTIHMSVQSTSYSLQNLIESKLQKKSRGLFVPSSGRQLVTFIDDFNTPAIDRFGIQSALEYIRMWIDHGFWYDRAKIAIKNVQNMTLFAAMGPPGGCRHGISSQLQNRFCVLNILSPQEPELFRIFSTMLKHKFLDMPNDIQELTSGMTQTILNTYKSVTSIFRPTPSKTHYIFSLSDIAKVVRGLLLVDKDSMDSKSTMLRYFCHECQRVFSDRLVNDSDRKEFDVLLNNEVSESFNLTLNQVYDGNVPPIFVKMFNVNGTYREVKSFELLKSHMLNAMDDHNQESGHGHLDIVLFKSALEHACRIARGIGNPGGNMLLIGDTSTGRQSLCELVAYALGHLIFQIKISRLYGITEFEEDLKTLFKMVGVENKTVVFLLSDIHLVNDSFMPYLNDILTSGIVPDLFAPEELDSIYAEMSSKDDSNLSGNEKQEIFFSRIHSNLHVVLKLDSSGAKFREHILNYPALINYSTIDWFEKWPTDALKIIAEKHLKHVDLGEPLPERQKKVSEVFSQIHKVSSEYAEKMHKELNRNVIINAANYLDLVQTFKGGLMKKTESMKTEINRLQSGLVKIDETEAKVNVMAAELEIAKLEVSRFQKECDEYLIVISQQKREADINREVVAAQSIDIEREESRCKKLAEAAEQDLNAVLPSLEEAKKALESLNKKDVGEIKSYAKPPILVETVLEAVMILRESDPTWAEAKRQLSAPFFLRELTEFDKDHITDRTLERIGKYMAKADFKPNIIGKVSTAARSLCMWVRAMYSYGRIYRMVLPKRQRLYAAQEELRKQQEQLAEAQRKLRELEEKILKLRKEYEDKLQRKEELLAEEKRLTEKLRTAADLVDGLRGEKGRWSKKVSVLSKKLEYVIGDCITATSFVSYLGAFISTFRKRLVSTWIDLILKAGILCHEEFDVADFLSTEIKISEWKEQGLPSDNYSVESAIIIFDSHKWPLIIDPEGQAVKWITKMEKQEGLKSIDLQDRSSLRTLLLALTYGTPVLIQNVLTDLDPAIFPILNKDVVCSGAELQIFDQKVRCNPNFRLYLATKLKNPKFIPDIACRTSIIDFAIMEKGLEDQLLSVVVSIESAETEERKIELVKDIASAKKKLQDIEDTVLSLLNKAQGSLLDDVKLVDALQKSKRTSINVETRLGKSQEKEKEVDVIRELYRPCASRGSILFFSLADMSALDPMYLFSLDPYISQFKLSINNSLPGTTLEARIQIIIDYHTYAVYEFACRAMFEKHKLLFSFHVCAKILEYAKELSMDEYDFFLIGGVVLDRAAQPQNPCQLWLPSHCWDNITSMEELPKFMDLAISFDENLQSWNEWYMNPEPEKVLLPGKWRNVCNDFQKMLFIRCLRTDRLTSCITAFVTKYLGKKFLEPPSLNMDSILNSSNCRTPLLFIISSGVDPIEYVQNLASKCEMKDKYFALSLGQGQAAFANELIEKAKVKGHWVYLANCHLLLSWLPDLEKITTELEHDEVHPNFRLWLSSVSTPQFPVSILQKCIKITMETPKGLKPNMKKLYGLIDEEYLLPEKDEKHDSYMKLLFSLSFFHSILIERKKFQHLGWNVVYDFTEADFLVSASILKIYLQSNENTPWDAIKELVVDVNYGGHVTDDKDMLLLNAYFEDYFSDETLKVDNFPLSNLDTYFIPEVSSLNAHIHCIDQWPQEEPPDVFGQNANAEIAFRIQEASFLLENLLKLHPTKMSSSKTSLEEHVLEIVQDVLKNIPDLLDQNMLLESTEHPAPYFHLLLQEVRRYNNLISLIKQSLKDLVDGIEGLQIMTPAIEDLFTTISERRVPVQWSKTYSSVKTLGSWIEDLKLRVQQVCDWISSGETPVKFWLSGFTTPKSILIAALQVFAREGEVLLHEYTWEFIVSALEEAHITEHADEGIYVRGLFLEGAGWDTKMSVLMEPEPMNLITAMPVIHFHPVREVNTRGQYHCPCYYIPKRWNEGASTFVMSVDLKSNRPQNYWIKRGAALLMNLD